MPNDFKQLVLAGWAVIAFGCACAAQHAPGAAPARYQGLRSRTPDLWGPTPADSSQVRRCRERFPAPPDFGSCLDPQQPPVRKIIADCRHDCGAGCDSSGFLSREAAECLASDAHLDAGIGEWETRLTYNWHFRTVIWSVSSTAWESADGTRQGDVLVFDATDGDLLGRYQWSELQ
jgi:hypothetical protein